jgi:probable rRNA maturation factor
MNRPIVTIDIQQDRVPISSQMTSLIQDICHAALKLEMIELPVEISILLVSNRRMRELNKRYRDIEATTDVLSFPMYDDPGEIPNEPLISLGDIVISMPMAIMQADEYGHAIERELGYLAVHGVLHLLGYDHIEATDKKRMRRREEEILESMNLAVAK